MKSKVALFALLAQLVFAGLGWSQIGTTAGSISGTVTDASGAAVAGALITTSNEATKVESTTTTNTDGSFVFPGLEVGTYTVKITKTGFQKYTMEHLIVHPATAATVNAALTVGAVTSEITVSAAVAQVQTTTGEVSNEVSAVQVSTLPLNGRNYQSLSALMPGVTNMSPGRSLGTGGFSTSSVLSVNGMGTSGTMFYLDGIWNMNTGDMSQTTIQPNPDTIEEVRVLQNNYSVQYNLNGMNVVLLETKAGTGTYHGSAFEYFRNDALNARNVFASSVPALKQSIFGYTLGGPIYIPNHYNTNRQRTFFFWSQQWAVQHVGSAITGATPTADMRNGIFNDEITNPTTGQPFPTNGSGQYVIPQNKLNSSSLALMGALSPLPNNGSGFLNYINLNPVINHIRDDEIKIDHNFSSSLRLTGEWLNEPVTDTYPYDNRTGTAFPEIHSGVVGSQKLAKISVTATLSPSMVNTTSISMNNIALNILANGTFERSQVPGFLEVLPYNNAFGADRLPTVTFAKSWTSWGPNASDPLTHAGDLEDSLSDDWSWLRGRHFIQAGMNIVLGTKRQEAFESTNGTWFFSGQFTGDPIADFLLGDPATLADYSSEPRYYARYRIASPYVQDRIKVSRKVTMTVGLRYVWQPFANNQPGFESTFVPALYNPAQAPIVNTNGTITPTANYNPLNGIVINGVNGIPLNFSTAHEGYWAPSFGFAWDPFGDGKTAVRGGYGITYTNTFHSECAVESCSANPPLVSSLSLVTPLFPNAVGGTVAPAAAPTFGASDDLKDLQAPYVQTYSLTLEHQFPGDWLVSMAGAGEIMRKLPSWENINQPLPDPPYNYNPVINSGTVFRYLYSPYQGYGSITDISSTGFGYWDALEISVRHPLGHDLFLNASYTWQKGLANLRSTAVADAAVGYQDIYHPGADYGTTNNTVPQILAFSYIWNLPWYRSAGGMKQVALGGWKYSGIATIQKGFYLDPGLSVSQQGLATRPNRVSGQSIPGPKTVSEWFNTGAFTAPAAGFLGNAAGGSILGPGIVNFDMAFYKDFRIRERHTIEFRAELFNIFNHTNFRSISTTYGASNFGNATAAADPRIAEFALRYQF